MKQIQTFSISLLLFVFLLIVVFAPPAVSKAKDQMIFGKVVTQQLTDTKDIAKSELSMADKIALISSYKAGRDSVIMVSQDQKIYEKGNQQDLADLAIIELEKLKRMDLFPPVEVSQVQNLAFAAQSYTNIDDPSMNTEIWNIRLSFHDKWMDIMMDSETNLIIQYQIWTKDDLKFMPAKNNADLFANYLGIKWDTLTLEKQSGLDQHNLSISTMGYYFIQINEKNNFGIQIAPVTD
ncbi:MAG: hypothetical protein K0Q48_526 [Bacillota bacterium]|jgi:hypothetical protein|nr:hypothetical protein [Bacillota bacterium]